MKDIQFTIPDETRPHHDFDRKVLRRKEQQGYAAMMPFLAMSSAADPGSLLARISRWAQAFVLCSLMVFANLLALTLLF